MILDKFSAAGLWARNEPFRPDWINDKIKGTQKGHLIAALLEIFSLFFLVIFFFQALRLTIPAKDWTPVFNAPGRCLYVCMPISGFIMALYSIRNSVREILIFWTFNESNKEQPPHNMWAL